MRGNRIWLVIWVLWAACFACQSGTPGAPVTTRPDPVPDGSTPLGADGGMAGAPDAGACARGDDCETGVCASGSCADHFSIVGRVYSAPDGAPLANATVSAPGGITTASDAQGQFALTVAAGAALLEVSKAGYTSTFVPISGEAGSTYTEAVLKAPLLRQSFAVDEPFVVQGGGVRITGPAQAFVTKAGAPVTGTVELSVTLVDPSDPLDARSAPFGFFVQDELGGTAPLSLRVADISAFSAGVELDVAPGVELIVDVRIDVEDAPLSAAVLSFDEHAGIWRHETTATRTLGAVEERVYRTSIVHLSYWSWVYPDYTEAERWQWVCADIRVTRDGTLTEAWVDTRPGPGYYWYWAYDGRQSGLWMHPTKATYVWATLGSETSPTVRVRKPASGCLRRVDLVLPSARASSCPSGTKSCGGQCKNLKTDRNHCGACGNACTSGKSCVGGTCACPEGKRECAGQCVDTRNDRRNCGGCGTVCRDYQECTGGSCVDTPCPGGMTRCGAECLDVSANNRLHCGACDSACDDGDYCSAGACVIVPVCGDGAVESGEWSEVCDDGVNDGSYGSCTPDCLGFGPRCGDGLLQTGAGETCDGNAPPCPESCDDQDPCTTDVRTGAASSCDVSCAHVAITAPNTGDGCCPPGAHAGTDGDCPPQCGNGIEEPTEACDDGSNTGAYGGCAPDCSARAPYCGDGSVQVLDGESCDIASASVPCPESCDDGDPCTIETEDGARAACTIRCSYETISVAVDGDLCCPEGATANDDADCPPVCGNALREGPEVCDDGVNDGSYGGCAPGCAALGPHCGDGAVQWGHELCDGDDCHFQCNDDFACTRDLDTGSALTCDHGCLFEPITEPEHGDGCCPDGANETADDDCSAVCGNGVRESGEACDDGNEQSGEGCSGDCQSDESCGNSIIDTAAGEVCDDGNTQGGDGCNQDCRSGEVCGNSIIDTAAGEVCDDGNTQGGDGCSANCRSDESCGNSIIDTAAGEVCDDGNTQGGDGCNSTCAAKFEVTQVALGFGKTCARLSNGRGYCWGSNMLNNLGVGSVGDVAWTPRQITGNRSDWSAFDTSSGGEDAHHCGLTTEGVLFCWGGNDFGKVGNGETSGTVTSPYQHTGSFSSFAAAGGVSTAVRADSALCRWGLNTGATTPSCSGTGWTSAAGLHAHTCMLKTDGTLWCFGTGSDGQLGHGSTSGTTSPSKVGTATDWLVVAPGRAHTCGIRGAAGSGSLWCWGDNEYGQRGFAGAHSNDGTVNVDDNSVSPEQTGTDSDWAQVAAGYDHTCALKTDRSLWCWGNNTSGQLGQGDTTLRTSPVEVGAESQWLDVAAGRNHSCAIRDDGTLWCFGSNSFGELGQAFNAAYSPRFPSPLKVAFP